MGHGEVRKELESQINNNKLSSANFPTHRRFRRRCLCVGCLPVCQVMHAAAYHTQPPPAAQGHADPLYASVGHLLSKACSNTCFTAAQAFAQLVQPTARFQLALDALLPILDSQRSEVSEPLSPRRITSRIFLLIC